MLKENYIVNTLWIGDSLSLLEQLTVKLLQQHGHEVHLWSYNNIQNVPAGTVLREAREILPELSIFKYTGKYMSALPGGGIGSLSHWSDQFQLKLLHDIGGIYLQLDVACFKSLDFISPYVFADFYTKKAISPFIMKCPQRCKFAKNAYETLSVKVNSNTIQNLQWDDSMSLMKDELDKAIPDNRMYILPANTVMDVGGGMSGPFFEDVTIPDSIHILHWSNATVRELKNNPIPHSVYYKLLKSVELI